MPALTLMFNLSFWYTSLLVTRNIFPWVRRFSALWGFINPARNSRQNLSAPLVLSSRIFELMRYKISPRKDPLMGVLMISFFDGSVFSPKYSHIKLPPTANGNDCQKL